MTDLSVSYDRTTKIVTALGCVLLAIPASALHHLAFRIVAILTLLVGLGYSPKPYQFAETPAVFQRLVRDVHVPLECLREVLSIGRDAQ